MVRFCTLFRQQNLDIHSKSFHKRMAYRGIISQGNKILVIKSNRFGEIKFPGGGKKLGESAYQVLSREILEETGYQIKTKIKPFFSILEYAKDFQGEVDLFIQDSKYYFCSVHEYQKMTSYSGYEVDYGYYPMWVTIEEAIKNNEKVSSRELIPWLERDTIMLKLLLEQRRK